MRQVKRWIAVVQAFALMVALFSGLVITTEVSATTAALAEMDLSAFSVDASVTANGILNSGSANDVSFVASGTTMPEVGSFNSLLGETKYLRFGERKGDGETTNDRVVDNTQDRKVTVSGASINNMEENTVSFWAYLDSKDSTDTVATDINMKDVFYYNGSTAGKYLARLRLYPWGTLTQYYNYDYDSTLDSFTTSPTDALIYSDVIRQKWAHIVYTTKYDETENEFTTQYIVNGVAKPAQVWPGPAGGRADETNFTYQLSEGFCGNIGGFKIYNSAFSEAEALALYNAEKPGYTVETATALSVVSILPEAESVLYKNSTMDIIFNTYPDLSTLNAITLENEDGDDVITSRSVNGKTVTIAWGTLEADCPYTLKIGAGLKSLSGLFQTSAPTNYNYRSGAFGVSDVFPRAGEISDVPGEILITFSSPVNEDTISGITFADTLDGTTPESVNISMQTDVSVKVKYSYLEKGRQYLLTIPQTVCDEDGSGLKNSYTVTYSTPSDAILYLDFEGEEFVPGEQCPPLEGLFATSSYTGDDWTDFKILEDKNTGKKYMSLVVGGAYDDQGKSIAAGTNIRYNVPASVAGETIAFEMKLRAQGSVASATRAIMRPYTGADATGTNVEFAYMQPAGEVQQYINNEEKDENGATPEKFLTIADKDEWHILKVVTGIRESDGKRFFDCYYDANDPTVFTRITNGNMNVPTIGSIVLANVYLGANSSYYNDVGVAIDYIKVSKVNYPEVIGCDTADLNSDINLPKIYFNKSLNKTSLENSEMFFKNEDGDVVRVEYKNYDSATRAASIKPYNYFLFGKTYSLFIKGISDTEGYLVKSDFTYKIPQYNLEQASITLVDENEDPVLPLKDAEKVKVVLKNNLNSSKEVRIFVQHYDSNGRLKSVTSTGNTSISAGNNSLFLALSDKAIVDGDYVEVYTWDVSEKTKAIALTPTVFYTTIQ